MPFEAKNFQMHLKLINLRSPKLHNFFKYAEEDVLKKKLSNKIYVHQY